MLQLSDTNGWFPPFFLSTNYLYHVVIKDIPNRQDDLFLAKPTNYLKSSRKLIEREDRHERNSISCMHGR